MRTRKCSIVQEEEDEDDVSSGRDERGSNSTLNSFNRRGSRSEGKLSHILQERLSQLPEKHTSTKPVPVQRHPHQKEDTVIAESSHRGERLKQTSRNEKDNKISSLVHPKGIDKVQMGNVLLEKLSVTSRITMTCEENLKNRLSGTNSPSAGWTARKATNTEVRPKSVTECLKSTGPIPANKWRMGAQHHRFSVPLTESPSVISSKPSDVSTTTMATTTITTKTLHESSTVSIPLHPISDNQVTLTPKYKTMPSPSGNSSATQLTLNEILEDGDGIHASVNSPECGDSTTKCRVVRRTTYEQRRSKFHKTRTTSCSSSDASDDDSESRKKRAHKLGASTGKPLPPRRDSHDDSSDSQDPGGSGGGRGGVGGGGSGVSNGEHRTTDTPRTTESNRNDSGSGTNTTNTSTTNGGGRHRCTENQVMFGRRHRAGRRRAGETRLRESQSLNRITEVQEAEAPSSCHNHYHVSRNSTAIGTQNITSSSSSVSQNSMASQHNVAPPASQVTTSTVQKAKGLGARLLQSWSLGAGKSLMSQSSKQSARSPDGKSNGCQRQLDDCQTVSGASNERRGDHKCANQTACNDKENRGNSSMNRNECKNRKIRLLSRYFAVHKKLCVPLPGIFGKGRLYKARSCGSITRDRVSPPSPKSMLLVEDKWRERRQWCDAATKQHRGSDGDINQNLGLAHLVQENIVGKGCAGMPNVCHIHLGDASKCCSLC